MNTTNERKIMTVKELQEFLNNCDPTAKVILLSSDRDDMGFACREAIDDDSGAFITLCPGFLIDIIVED